MFVLHSSNKTENLVMHLTTLMRQAPLSNPFAKEVFLIQSQGMERWLSLQLATEFNVFTNAEFLFPARFFSTMAQRLDSQLNDAHYDRTLMLWRIEALLRTLDNECFRPLQHYLHGQDNALKRYQLAQQLAQLFDQYQILRPDLLAAWQDQQLLYQTDTERWQSALWRLILQQTVSPHRGELWLAAIDKLMTTPEYALSSRLPERITLFGISSLPPLFLHFLQGLARHCQVHCFLLNPAETFWADVVTRRQQFLEHSTTELNGHPLLASLGQQGRDFYAMLLESGIEFSLELESFEPAPDTHLLHQLQNDILTNTLHTHAYCLEAIPLGEPQSISIHACHSRLREVQVLKNQLLLSLEHNPTLELRDIIVMAPDIQVYEPLITAIFHDIQYSIADRSLRLVNPLLDSFIRFLKLSQSRFGWQNVIDLLERPEIHTHFDLAETDLDIIKHWLSQLNVRWGKSASHKAELALPAQAENTWQAALNRLLMGYAMSNEQCFFDDVLPYPDIEGSDAHALGGLCDFITLLFNASTECKHPKLLPDWSAQLLSYAASLFGNTASPELQEVNTLLLQLQVDIAVAHQAPVSLEVISNWLESTSTEQKSRHGFLRGQLTFCSILPMRAIPFAVIALLGMNEGEFPTQDSKPTFDLLSQYFRKGDRSRRTDDRYQFLEILLSARRQLIITFLGQSQRHNGKIPPAIIVSELIDVIEEQYGLTELICYEPLQAFSPRYFNGTKNLISFSHSDCSLAQHFLAPPANTFTPWWQESIPTDSTELIDINDVVRFFKHPQKYFLNQRFNLRLDELSAKAEEREPFALDTLQQYTIHQHWLNDLLNDTAPSLQRLQAQGKWLVGTPGCVEFSATQKLLTPFSERIQQLDLGAPEEELTVDIKLEHFRLIGKLSHRYQHGSAFYRYANIKGKDFLEAWLHHLISNQYHQPTTTYLISKDYNLCLLPEHCQTQPPQTDYLLALINCYARGQTRPDAFFTEAAFSYFKTNSLSNAKKSLENSLKHDYELELRKLYHHIEIDTLINTDFIEQCNAVFPANWKALVF